MRVGQFEVLFVYLVFEFIVKILLEIYRKVKQNFVSCHKR